MPVLTDPAAARGVVESQHRLGYDFIKVYNSLPKAVYDTIVTVAREVGMPVAGHVPFAVGLFGAFAARQASIEHLRGYIAELVPKTAAVQPGPTLRSRSVAWNYVDRTRIPGLVRATVAARVWNCPTLMVTAELLAPPETWDSLARRPELRFLGRDALEDRARIPYLKDFTADDYRESNRGVGAQLAVVGALHRAGARLLAGTDSYLQGFALQAELLLLERAGLSRSDVLRVATRNAAEYFGQARDWGAVEPGMRADLQLIDGDPLASLDALRRRSGVMVRGRWLSRNEIDARLDALARSYEAH
jgi:imidazolonepropionase-like amidohydrolase